jgi:hypothetical protein
MDELYQLTVMRLTERRAAAQLERDARPGTGGSTMLLTAPVARHSRGRLRGRVGRLLIALGRTLEGRDDPVLAPSQGTARGSR